MGRAGAPGRFDGASHGREKLGESLGFNRAKGPAMRGVGGGIRCHCLQSYPQTAKQTSLYFAIIFTIIFHDGRSIMISQPIPTIPRDTPVLVTGASGFTGSLLTRKLAAAGLDVRAIARGSSRIDHLRDVPIAWHVGDIFDPGVVRKAARGVQYIFHVAAAYRQANVSNDFYRQVHVDSTKLLAYRFQVPENEGLAQTGQWYVRQGLLKAKGVQ
jgi:hypothetical protein